MEAWCLVDFERATSPTRCCATLGRGACALLALPEPAELQSVQITYTTRDGGDAQNILGFYARCCAGPEPAAAGTLAGDGVPPDRSAADVQIGDQRFTLGEADTCCAPGYTAVTLTNLSPHAELHLHRRRIAAAQKLACTRTAADFIQSRTDHDHHLLWARRRCIRCRARQERTAADQPPVLRREYTRMRGNGRPVDKSVELPFYFTKAPGTLVESGATVAYPTRRRTTLRDGAVLPSASRASASRKPMRRADLRLCLRAGHDAARLQLVARDKGRPGPGKDVEQSSWCRRSCRCGQVIAHGALE